MFRQRSWLTYSACTLSLVLGTTAHSADQKKSKKPTTPASAAPASSAAIDPAKVDAKAVLEKAEAIRNPIDTYKVGVKLADIKEGKETDVRTYESIIKEGGKTRVNFIAPATEEGKRVLMIENDMWFFAPTTAKPIRIAPRQKIAGNAVYGDIAKLSFTNNYTTKVNRIEKVEGKDVIVLDLDSIEGKPVTYEKVEYWIEASSNKPLKAVYATRAGKQMRIGHFEKYEAVMGEQRPTQLRIESMIEKDRVSILSFSNQEKVNVPDQLFDKESLKSE